MATKVSFGRRTPISVETKLAVLEALKKKSKVDVAKEFGIGYSTVKKIKQREIEILKKSNVSSNLYRIRDRKSRNDEIGDAVITWYHQMKADNAINGPIMQDKAKEIAHLLGYDDFKPSHGWLERLKARNNIRFLKPFPKQNGLEDSIETKSSTPQSKTNVAKTNNSKGQFGLGAGGPKIVRKQNGTTKNKAKPSNKPSEPSISKANNSVKQQNFAEMDNWIKNILPPKLEEYDPDDVFNATESVLFYKAAPSILTGNYGQIGMIKERLTIFFMCNATGTEKYVYVIGKSTSPPCFEKQSPPLPYYSNKNASMNEWIWRDILQKLNQSLGKRKIIIFVKNVACHKVKTEMKNVKVSLLPTNPALIQPLEQGIIRQVKIHYRGQLLKKLIAVLNNGILATDFAKTIDLFQALRMLQNAWCSISESMIVDCFQKAGFYADDVYCLEQSPDTSKEATELKELLQEEFDAFVECDKDVECFQTGTDSVVPAAKPERPQTIKVDEAVNSSTNSTVSHNEALRALSVVRKYLQANFTECNAFYEVEEMVRLNAYANGATENMMDSF